VRVSENQDLIDLVVSDNDSGVPEEFQDSFFRRGTSSKGKAGGLGLHLCRQIIERTGGSIELQKKERGATFLLKLPAK